jgi:WD40 repeat protein
MNNWISSIDILLVNAWSLAFSPDGQYLATGSFGGKVDLYNSESGQKEKTLDTQTKFVLSAIYVRQKKTTPFFVTKMIISMILESWWKITCLWFTKWFR